MIGERLERTVKVLEIRKLDTLAHAKSVRGSAKAVAHHPNIAGVQGRDLISGSIAALKSVCDIGPRSNDRAENHQAEGEKSHGRDGTAEPEDLTVGNEDDSQVLEDGIDGNREELKSLCAGVDHANKEERDGEPYYQRDLVHCVKMVDEIVDVILTFPGLILAEVTVSDKFRRLASLNGDDTDNRLEAEG